MRFVIECPSCTTINTVDAVVPLREQFCELCRCALQLDEPVPFGFTNHEPCLQQHKTTYTATTKKEAS